MKPPVDFDGVVARTFQSAHGQVSVVNFFLCGDFGIVNFNLQMVAFNMPKVVFTTRLKLWGYAEKCDPVFGPFFREIR